VVSIAIVGPGAVGGTLAAHLASRRPGSVSVAARTAFPVLEARTVDGLLRSTPVIYTDPGEAEPADWVLLATKAYDTAAAAVWLPALTGPHSTVAVLQNGVEHLERLVPYWPAERLLPVVVNVPAHRSAPGRIVQRGTAELTVPSSRVGARFAELFTGTGVRVAETDDFATAAWRKLALNAAGAITAATLVTRLDMTRPSTEGLVRHTVGEAIAVGRAEGATLPDDVVDDVVGALSAPMPAHPNSMHEDRLAGRPMEIDARNGAIVRIGRRHGIPTPVNALLVDLLRIADAERRDDRPR
jgi:2-dehydropantoate 2-reductase